MWKSRFKFKVHKTVLLNSDLDHLNDNMAGCAQNLALKELWCLCMSCINVVIHHAAHNTYIKSPN